MKRGGLEAVLEQTLLDLYPRSALLNLPLRAAYSDRTAWLMARCAALAYVKFETGHESQLRELLKELGLNFLCGFNRGGTQAYLASSERFAVLSFRGTEKDYRDILTDIDIRFYHDKSGARIADGFSKAYALVQDDIAAAVGTLSLSLPLYITGHSLGGALAVIASMNIHPSDRIAACYTYGCPRFGNAEFVSLLCEVPVYRLVHYSDIVPRVPFGFGYRQVGDLRYIKRRGSLVQNPNSIGLLVSFLLNLVTNFKNVFENHRVSGYVASLKSWMLARLEFRDATLSGVVRGRGTAQTAENSTQR